MHIFATLNMLITVTSVFPQHAKGCFPFSSCSHFENRRFLLLKESPGDHDIKILKSVRLLSTVVLKAFL